MYEPLRCRCDDYKCNNPVISSDDEEHDGYLLDPTCILCEQSMCKEHTYFVRETGRIKEFVCDRCYQVCMMAYQNKQKEDLMRNAVVKSGLIAGEDLRRGFVRQGPDGLIYQARAERIEHD